MNLSCPHGFPRNSGCPLCLGLTTVAKPVTVIQEYLDRGWAVLFENEGGVMLIGPINKGCIDNGSQLGCFNRKNQSAEFHKINLGDPKVQRAAMALLTAVITESKFRQKLEG